MSAAEGDEDQAMSALTKLCEHYRPAVQAYFRIKCRDPQAAEDLANSFALHLLEKNRFRTFEKRPNQRFRNFLSRALKNFLLDHLPPPPPAESPSPEVGPVVGPNDGEHVDMQVALAVHDRAIAALESGLTTEKERVRYQRLKQFIVCEGSESESAAAANHLEINLNNFRVVVHRLRREWARCFRAEVADMVQHQREELDEEVRYLIGLLPRALALRSS